MPLDQQSQIYHFSLVFQCVKMKVKFPCKLSLQHMGNAISNEVSTKEQNKFLINEEVTIKDQSQKKFVQIVVNLITQKGSKYIAGIIKLFHNQLLRSEGQRIIVALGKCLDTEAFCEVKVEKVVTQKVTKRNPVFGGSRVGRDEQSFSPAQNQGNFKSATNLGNGLGTRSQAQFNLNPVKGNREWQQKRETCPMTYYQKNKPSPPRTRRKIGDLSKAKLCSNIKIRQDQQNTNRQKLIQAQVYKQNYVNMKQKYRKQSQNYKVQLNKRISLQNNENNYKLQIVRLRLKCEQLQKGYNEKNLRLKDLQVELGMLQLKDIDFGYYKEQTQNLKNNIGMLEDSIITLNSENQKLKELNKEREHQYETKMNHLQSQYEKVKNMYESKQCEYERDMRVMKEELIQLEYELNFKTECLKKKLYEKQQMLQEARSQLNQLQFTLSSNKMDHDASINQLDKKTYQMKQFIAQIEQKNQFQHNFITSLEQKCYELDKETIDMKSHLIAEKEISYKRENQVMEGLHQIKHLQHVLEVEKIKQNKLLQTVSNLQVELATQKETRLKLQKNLIQEQEKKRQLKAFSANIIKEKQTIIKQQLQHHQKLSQLQNKLIQSEHHKQLLLQQIDSFKTQVSTQRVQYKRVTQLIKETQKQLLLQKSKLIESQKSIKQKQKLFNDLETSVRQQHKKHQQKQSQYKRSVQQLNEQISFMANHKQKLTEDMNQKLLIAQKQIKAYQTIVHDQKSQLQQLQQHLYAYKQKSRVLEQTLTSRQHELNELRYKTEHLQCIKTDLQQDSKDKEENMYQLSATIYELESRMASLMREKQVEIEEINNQWNEKYEDLYLELEQRFQLIEKEKLYLQQQIVQKQNQINNKIQDKKTYESQSITSRKLIQLKIKKLEQERLSLLTTKNNQLQRQSQQLKQLFQIQKKKQAENRKLSHELQIARNQIMKLDTRMIELDNKIKSINKLYQQQLEEMKKKQLVNKNFKEEVINQQWNTQRELRKTLQAFTKGFLTFSGQAKDKTELIQLIKNLQTGIIAAIRMFDEKN